MEQDLCGGYNRDDEVFFSTVHIYNECEIPLPEGYIFKDQIGNEIHALKIVLEKANTLKTQSDNMETETHRGYYTTEEETANKSKKVAWFSFWDNDFADKVELDLSNRELIQEDGKWFVVKKKKTYPKSYKECCKVLGIEGSRLIFNSKDITENEENLICKIGRLEHLIVCRNAYWKIAGEELGLGKPWEPDYMDLEQTKFCIVVSRREVGEWETAVDNYILAFPTREMRVAFHEAFKKEIEICKELL